jgi:glycosyltransferase involved in cell wall biosynthesis
MSEMRVLLWMIGGDRIPGGHRVQLDQTSRYLRELGVETQVSFEEQPDLASYDLVHGFGLHPADLRRCRQAGLPVALSTIYWSRNYTSGQHDTGKPWDQWRHRGRMGLVLLRSALLGQHVEKCEAFVEGLQVQRLRYEMADILLPNSQMEAETIQAELGVTTPFYVVPNAVDHHTFRLGLKAGDAPAHVLFAGRFEPHKNQLGLIEAMRSSDIPVVLVGPPHPDHAAYYAQCKRRATKNISILPGVLHDELAPLYAAAKVHVLPSWFETTGLVSLEAALCGCNIVTTERGYAREYFQDMAWYCNPADPRSVGRAVEAAFHAPVRADLREHILSNFTWEHTATATLEAYRLLLGKEEVSASAG